MNALRFVIGQENSPVVEKIPVGEDSESLMQSQCRNALVLIDEYLRKSEGAVGDVNNIFAFVGERGSGKTSAMESVALCLTDSDLIEGYGNLTNLKDTKFVQIGPIDPAFFDSEHNILSLLQSQLYHAYEKNEQEHPEAHADRNLGLKLGSKFAQVQRYLHQVISSQQNKYVDELDKLVESADAMALRDEFEELVNLYVKYMGEDGAKLLIMIDDLDLDAVYGSQMAEQIRKYLSLPNIVVLMALKLDQLAAIKRQDFLKAYSVLLANNQLSQGVVDEMVERYMAKLIPQSHRIYMPVADDYHNRPLVVVQNGENLEFDSVKQAILELIYRKTRYLFFNTTRKTCPIVPRNLRELRQLIALLCGMHDFQREKDKQNDYNKSVFKNYLFENWTIDNLDADMRQDVYEIRHTDNAVLLNRTIIDVLCNRYAEDLSDTLPESELGAIVSQLAFPYNLSAGDVLGLITWFEQRHVLHREQKYFFILRTIYSMWMNDAYCSLLSYMPSKNGKSIKGILLQNEKLSHLNAYEKLVGGRLMNFRLYELLPCVGVGKASRSHREISLTLLKKLINQCIEDWPAALADGRVQLAEFFMLCIYRSRAHKPIGLFSKGWDTYRVNPEVAYDASCVSAVGEFDLGAFFFNLVRIKDCYSRFPKGRKFFTKIEQEDPRNLSLYSRFMQSAEEAKFDFEDKNDAWLRLVVFRNVEILQNFVDDIEAQRIKPNQDGRVFLYDLFKAISEKVNVPIYEKVGGKYQKIEFGFLSPIVEALNKNPEMPEAPMKEGEQKAPQYWFYKIYGEELIPEAPEEEAIMTEE